MDKKIKKPNVKANEEFLEIKHGKMFLKVPNNLHDVSLAKNFLATFEELLKELPDMPLTIEDADEDEVPQETKAKKIEENTVDMDIPEVPEEKEEGIPQECPLCQANVKVSKPRKEDGYLIQTVKCKKNTWFGSCKFKKDYAFRI